MMLGTGVAFFKINTPVGPLRYFNESEAFIKKEAMSAINTSHAQEETGRASTNIVRRRINPDSTNNVSRTQGMEGRTSTGVKGNTAFSTVLNSSMAAGLAQTKEPKGNWVEYTIKSGDTIWDLAVNRYHVNVDDVLSDNRIADPRKIQPGDKIMIHIPSYPSGGQEVTASWYGKEYHGRAMANGDSYDMFAPTIAHKDLPFGTRVELENKETGVKVKAVVTDRGPFISGRDVDLSYGLARILSIDKKGVGRLVMRVLG
jgi:rare lipoprotein A